MKAPETIETPRLILQRPTVDDIPSIFATYASDPEVTRYLAWPRHASIADTEWFFKFSESEWARWPAGPYLVRSRATTKLIGSSGLAFDSANEASTGYVFAREAWGHGFASETLRAIVDLARDLDVRRLYAICHSEHRASARVLEKAGFLREKTLSQAITFPNLGVNGRCDAHCYAINPQSRARDQSR